MGKCQNIRFENPHKQVPSKGKEDKPIQILAAKIQNLQIEKVSLPFNLGIEIAKIKISVPLTKLIKNETYKAQITQTLNIGENEDSMNLFDDQLKLIFGPDVDDKPLKGGVPPFYISLSIHDKFLHNAMLDSGHLTT